MCKYFPPPPPTPSNTAANFSSYSFRPSTEILFLKHDSSIFRQSFNPVHGFSMMEQGRICAVWPTENWLGSSMNHIQGWRTVWESYFHALEKGCLAADRPKIHSLGWKPHDVWCVTHRVPDGRWIREDRKKRDVMSPFPLWKGDVALNRNFGA